MTTETKAKKEEKAIVQYKGEPVTISFGDVKKYICPLATSQEVVIFLKTCQSLSLSPWASEIYLIKYSEEDKAATVIAIDSYLKAGETNQNYDGHEAGVVLKDSTGKLEFREGSLILDGEYDRLVGGWARVYRKDRTRPFYMAVNKAESVKYTKGGNLTKFWTKEKQPMMLRKTALKRALVEAFPSLFAGIMSTAEVAEEPEAEYHEIAEGELPPALEKGGKPDWKKFWARVKSELGLTTEEARLLLGVDSIKEELIDAGWTMEKIWDELVQNLQEKQVPTTEDLKQARGEIAQREAEEDIFGEEAEAIEAPRPEIPENPIFQNWGELAQAAATLGVTTDDVFKRAKVKKWQDFADYQDAWNWVAEIVMERKEKPRMI